MAVAFPTTPFPNQVVTDPVTNATWRWDAPSQRWVPAATGATFLTDAPGSIAGDGNLWAREDGQWASVPTFAQINTGRNVLNNSSFGIRIRGAGPFTAFGYTADRWMLNLNADANSVTFGGFPGLQDQFVGAASAGAASVIQQRVQGAGTLAGVPSVVSFTALATVGTPRIGVGFNQYFGTGGSANVNGNFGVTPPLTATPTRYQFSTTMPSTSGATFGTGFNFVTLELWLSDGSGANAGRSGGIGQQSGTVQISNVQWEAGTEATSFEPISTVTEILNCARYAQGGRGGLGGYATTGVGCYYNFPLTIIMAATPTVTVTFVISAANVTGQTITGQDAQTVRIYTQAAATGGYAYEANFIASADL